MPKITSFSQLELDKYYSYSDYITWNFKERVELFLGKVMKMSPAPNVNHQKISGNLFLALGNQLKNTKCHLFSAPFDVRLPISKKKGNFDTVVQPDIVVICDTSKLDEQGCNGAPDIVIEILSPGNSTREMKDKFELYEASLVPEYWMVDPAHQDITVYTFNDQNKYIGSKPFVDDEVVRSTVINGLDIVVDDVFEK
ncbi:MAG: Uma2 family endonuclease [Saprospiraceae bacterium]